MLYVFFWVIPRRLNFICRRFGTLCLFHLHRQVGVELHLPEQSVPKRRHTKFRRRGITQKKTYNLKHNKFQTAFEEKRHITEGTTLLRKKVVFLEHVLFQAVRRFGTSQRGVVSVLLTAAASFANATNVFFFIRETTQVRGQTEFQTVSKISTQQSWQLFL